MTKHLILTISATLLLGLSGCRTDLKQAASMEMGSEDRPPNFVVFMADDLGAPELASYGNTEHRTPNLDRLAEEGMLFRTAYATPICSPSRAMIMTGRYGFHTGWYNFKGRPGSPDHENPDYEFATAEVTFADMLKEKGYATALAGKWQMIGEWPTVVHDAGFDEYRIWAYTHYLPPDVEHTGRWENKNRPARFWHPSIMQNGEYMETGPDDYGPDLYTDFIIDFIERHRDEPFLAYYPMALTHTPWEPAPSLENPGEKTEDGLKHNVEAMDRVVGRVVSALDRLGLREETLVIFTGDNGTQGAGKARPTEQGAWVPFIASMPGTVQQDVVTDEPVDLSDVLPTLADMAGAPLPEDRPIDGRSLAPTLQNPDVEHRDWIFSYLHEDRILRTERWLLETAEGGRFYDCSGGRHAPNCDDVSGSTAPEVVAARARFDQILEDLPAPVGLEPCPFLERHKAADRAKSGT